MKPMLLVLLALTMFAASACVVVPVGPPGCCYGGPVVYGGYGRGDWHGEGWRR